MRLSCLQYTAEPSVVETEARLYPLLAEAARAGSDLIVLPECALCLSRGQKASRRAAITLDDPAVTRLSEFAARHGLWLIVGSLTMQTAEGLKNRTLVLDRSGALVATYDKIHLFDVELPGGGESYRESAVFAAGTSPQWIDIEGVRCGLSICFDVRFPKLYRHYAKQGADLVVVPAAFTVQTGQAHWHTLLRARAIENGLFVAAAGQCGVTREGRQTFGHSVVYDPWGEPLGALEAAPGVLTVDLDVDAVRRMRTAIPVMTQDRDF